MEKNGIGTDATHADHIKKIIEREYVFKSREGYLTPSTLGIGLVEGYDDIGLELSLSKPYLRREMERELRRICGGAKTKEEVIRESVNLYQAVYTRSVEQVDRLEQALSRCLEEQPIESAGGGWTPTAAEPGGEEVCRCLGCGNGILGLRSRASGGWMVGCSLYPQCRRVVWVPTTVAGISVSIEHCSLCETPSSGAVKLLDIRFRPGAVPPGTPSPYRGCILGCDELINELFDAQSAGSAGRQQPPAPPAPPPGQQISHGRPPASGLASGRQSPAASFQLPDQRPPPLPPLHRQQQNGAGSAGLSDNPPCNCGTPSAQRVTAKEGPNKGRPFFVCSKGRDAQCDFFQWADQPSTSNGASSSGGGGGGGGRPFSNPSPGGSYSQQSFSEPPSTKPKCRCGLYAALKTKASGGDNSGREYYLCTREFRGCGFVCWKDEAEAYTAGSLARPAPSAATSSECYKCGQTGHWSRDCPNGSAGSDFASGSPPPHIAGGPVRRGRARGKARAPSTRGRRGRGRGRGAASSRARAGAKDEGDSADPDPGFGFWS
ncbi:DNA topoisomerase 3-alpha [Coemansia biformis]|uniref:DNA topoisomerase n=1 Tax=Coemansia biformis TaxID=1286918 RepID=A0A9W7XWT5_9FUNG|nr:DNA topoisomerase 3-alpha [Coemansia biformis]